MCEDIPSSEEKWAGEIKPWEEGEEEGCSHDE
jgi:hypothetical protein